MQRRSIISLLVAAALAAGGLTFAPPQAQADPFTGTIDTSSKAAVQDAYLNTYLPALSVPLGWNGNSSTCDAGTISDAGMDAVVTAANFMRAMAGLPTLLNDASESAKAQQAALMMQARYQDGYPAGSDGALSHTRGMDWRCATADGVYTAGSSENIAYGSGGAFAPSARTVAAWMQDAGLPSLGHRRAILSGRAISYGFGATNQYAAMHYIQSGGAYPTTSYAWPSAGYFPYELLATTATPSWSFYPGTGSAAAMTPTVVVSKNGAPNEPVAVTNVRSIISAVTSPISDSTRYGLGWDIEDVPAPAAGTVDVYTVTVGTYPSYQVSIFNATEASIGSVTLSSTTPVVGQALTATATGVAPADATLTYQWKSNGADVGTNSATYTPVAGDLGNTITVSVTASKAGFLSASASAGPTSAVGAGTMTHATPSVSPSTGVVIGTTLTAVPGDWQAGVEFAYQWLRDGVAIGSATASTYVVTAADVGAQISVRVIGTLAGYADVTDASGLTNQVPVGTLTTATPTITGVAEVGQTLTMHTTAWSPSSVVLTQQWFADGTAITGATETTYTLTTDEIGQVITVKVTGTLAGYTTATTTSAGTEAVTDAPLPPVTADTVTISGTPTVGQTLTANEGAWLAPGQTVFFAYQWLRDGAPISGATTGSYTLVAADASHEISVMVTGSATGYASDAAVSDGVGPVALGTLIPGTVTIDDGSLMMSEIAIVYTGTWSPTGVDFTYQWLLDGEDIAYATDQGYPIIADDIGHTLSVRVTGSLAGYESVTVLATAAHAVLGLPSTAGSPTISGTAAVGSTLTVNANAATWSPSTMTFSYQWMSGGAPVGANSTTYTPTVSDLGNAITCVVTGQATAFQDATATAGPVTVIAGTMTPGTVSIAGTAAVGQTLTAQPSGWPIDSLLTYQWFDGTTPLSTASADPTYLVTPSDLGNALTVVLTATQDGYDNATAQTSTGTISAGTMTAPTPTITGAAAVGQTLNAQPGSWAPSTVSLAYQWFADGNPISGADTSTYTLTADELGLPITVQVTGTATGYTTTTKESAATANVTENLDGLSTAVPTISGTVAVGQTVTADSGTWGPAGVSVALQWLCDGTPIDSATGASYVIVPADLGCQLAVSATGTLAGYATASEMSLPSTVAAGTITGPIPSVDGSTEVGQTLTADAGSWLPAGVALAYQWLRDGSPIDLATDDTYVTTTDDVGAKISVAVTGTLTGYTDLTRTSAQTDTIVAGLETITPDQPTIGGTLAVGETLTASPGTWDPPSGVTFTYQWLADDVPIVGATVSTYTLTSAEQGKGIKVKVTGTRDGYAPASATSVPTDPVTAGAITAGTPVISGTEQVGKTLTVDAGTWSPTGVSLAYQWLRDGTPITGATTSSYTLTSDDEGLPIAVQVTGTLSGYSTEEVLAAATGAIAPEPVPSLPDSSVAPDGTTASTTGGAARLADGSDTYILVVTVADDHGIGLPDMGSHLSVDAPTGLIVGTIVDNGDGTYNVPLSSSTPGNYEVSVLLDGQAINGDPIDVNFIGATVGTPTVSDGDTQTAIGSGFVPGEQVQVTVFSSPIDLGVHTANADGTVSVSFTVPAGFASGSHRVEFSGLQSGKVSGTFNVRGVNDVPSGGNVASSTIVLWVVVGVLVVGAAVFLIVFLSRRRKGSDSTPNQPPTPGEPVKADS